MNNISIREFEIAITNYVNSSPLPLEVKRLAVSDILHQLEEATTAELQKEIVERDRMASDNERVENNEETAVEKEAESGGNAETVFEN